MMKIQEGFIRRSQQNHALHYDGLLIRRTDDFRLAAQFES